MRQFSYTKSPNLTNKLNLIDDLRKQLLIMPISPRDSLKLRWYGIVDHIYYSFLLKGESLDRDKINDIFGPAGGKRRTSLESQISNYRRALNYLYLNWLVSPQPVTAKTLIELYKIAFDEKLQASVDEIDSSLKYIQVNPEHPVVQAALAQIIIIQLIASDRNFEQFSQLVFLLFLYKNGYDFRRLLVVEKIFFTDIAGYKNLINNSSRQNNVTSWLEYITESISKELENLLKKIKLETPTSGDNIEKFELNDRQQDILALFDKPGVKITNKIVQKMFKVSQITASRDLTKLANLGLLFTIGKGRSTYYTKI